MSTTESLRIQIDALRIEKQQLSSLQIVVARTQLSTAPSSQQDLHSMTLADLIPQLDCLFPRGDVHTLPPCRLAYVSSVRFQLQDQQEKNALQEKCSFQESQVE